MNRPLKREWINPFTGEVHEVANYLTKEECSRIRKDKLPMYVQTAYERIPVYCIQDITGTYGKAKIYGDGNTLYLRSYDTIVCSLYKCYADRQYHYYFTRYWDDWSRTTNNHVTAFMQMFGLTGMSKKQWMDYPLYKTMEVYR